MRSWLVKHCDDYIDDETQPLCLRRFLRYQRWPATYRIRAERLRLPRAGAPPLFADYKPWFFAPSRRVRVTFASRMGDVGISFSLRPRQYGYDERVWLKTLCNFSVKP